MPERLEPPSPSSNIDPHEDSEDLKIPSRSPHPYHRQQFELLEPSERLVYRAATIIAHEPGSALTSFTKGSTPTSDSGTEADDEHILKRLPAPKTRLHKGLRGKNESLSGSSTPLLSPALLEEEGRSTPPNLKHGTFDNCKRLIGEKRRRKELVRRAIEVLLLVSLGALIQANRTVRPFVASFRREFAFQLLILALLTALYPLRVILWAYRQGKPSKRIPITVPSSFDPAPILYPQLIPIFVSLLIAVNAKGVILPNLVLSLCTIPRPLIPAARFEPYNPLHWVLSCIPVFLSDHASGLSEANLTSSEGPPKETLVLLYPLHQYLCFILSYLTTTSLLSAELQLLSVSLINILLLSQSPQVVILKGMLWGGGLGIIILCDSVIRWGIALARVPKWRFRRVPPNSKGSSTFRTLRNILLFRRSIHDALGTEFEDSTAESANSSDGDYDVNRSKLASLKRLPRAGSISGADSMPLSPADTPDGRSNLPDELMFRPPSRRHTLPSLGRPASRSKTHTPSGRRKRSASSTVRSFFSLTQAQATVRKWLYAGHVYTCILAVTLIGLREYVKNYALSGDEPIGWALGYLFGDLPQFRFQVVKANLERWICLPPRSGEEDAESCPLGWVQHLRHASFGEANTRLILSIYWLAMIVMGLAVVFQLSPIYEVDTCRKVFHFMMVAMFLPATYVDPTYAAFALSLVLALFLLLDLLRASQLPPLSKPIANFLTPYVDGRDLRGPVVISHIFLLIGCAIPLWLSLAALPRTGSGSLEGWEVPTRDVSMVSGVVCVGLGDSAASLIGRRWGHHKWLWGGGKSLEGSVAFAAAAFVGLAAANVWLKVGGWPVSSVTSARETDVWSLWSWGTSLQKTGICASMASLTEAVLTGGNDNVVVPVVLWACVKSIGI